MFSILPTYNYDIATQFNYQYEGNYSNWQFPDNLFPKEFLPSFFTLTGQIIDISTLNIYKLDSSLLKYYNSISDIETNAILETINIPIPTDYIYRNDNKYYSRGIDILPNELEKGCYFFRFSNGSENFISDIFYIDGITSGELVDRIHNSSHNISHN